MTDSITLGNTRDFWRGRRVFLTGHTGFKGGWLSLLLQELGADLTGYSLDPPTRPSLFESVGVARGMLSVIGDIRDRDLLTRTMNEARPEIAFHLAAQPLVLASYQDPVTTFDTNVMGLVHFLEAVRSTESVRAIVVVTSDKCYENRDLSRGYCEDDPMGGHDPYSCSKGCAELVASSYRRSYLRESGQALATVRAGNVIGGGDWAENRLIPDLVRAFSRGETLFIRNPAAIRPWQHVLDPIRGYLMLARRLFAGETDMARGWNFGPAEESMAPVHKVVTVAARLWGGAAKWESCSGPGLHEARILNLDCGRSRAELGWFPKLGLSAGLEQTMDWYRRYCIGESDMRRLTLNQIRAHFSADEAAAPAGPERVCA